MMGVRNALISRPFPNFSSSAEKLAHSVDEDHVNDWIFRRSIFKRIPERLSIPLAEIYTEKHKNLGRKEANLFLLDFKEKIDGTPINLSSSDSDIVEFSKKRATEFRRLSKHFRSNEEAFPTLAVIAEKEYGITPPKIKDHDRKGLQGGVLRLCDEQWWRRKTRITHIRGLEQRAIGLGLVNRNKDIYVSNETVHRRFQQLKRNKKILEQCIATNELGYEASLLELSEHSISNPKNQRAELMVRIRGTENISESLGHEAVFCTLTCPSKMHPWSSNTKHINPKYDSIFTPAVAHKYLTQLWAQIRAKLARMGVLYYGFRVVEPHHDGTPHWHFLLFMPDECIVAVTETLRSYALKMDPLEKGAKTHRFTFEKINKQKGSATGYIAKYISKNIDGFAIDEDLYGKDAANSAKRVKAWASTWGIRQFQQVGGPPVTPYRELRRITGDNLTNTLTQAWKAANEANWENYVHAMGGIYVDRKNAQIKVARKWNDSPNKYLEPKGWEIFGLSEGSLAIPTRIHQWSISFSPKSESKFVTKDRSDFGFFKEGRSFGPLEYCQ